MKKLLVICFLCACTLLQAQKFLAVDSYRFWHFKRQRVYPGQEIGIKLKEGGRMHTYTIVGLDSNMIYLDSGDGVALNEIKALRTHAPNWFVRKLYKTAMVGGVALVAVDMFNNLTGGREVYDQTFVLIGGSMVAAGVVLKLLTQHRVHPGKHVQLKVIDLSLQ